MFFTTKIASSGALALFTLAFTSPWVAAAPLAGSHTLLARDTIPQAPKILSPTHSDVLVVGQRFVITWDPKTTTSSPATIQLGRDHFGPGFSPIELASEFSIVDGRRDVLIPEGLESGDDYQVGVFSSGTSDFPAGVSRPFIITAQ